LIETVMLVVVIVQNVGLSERLKKLEARLGCEP